MPDQIPAQREREIHGEQCPCCNTDWAKIGAVVQGRLDRALRQAGG